MEGDDRWSRCGGVRGGVAGDGIHFVDGVDSVGRREYRGAYANQTKERGHLSLLEAAVHRHSLHRLNAVNDYLRGKKKSAQKYIIMVLPRRKALTF